MITLALLETTIIKSLSQDYYKGEQDELHVFKSWGIQVPPTTPLVSTTHPMGTSSPSICTCLSLGFVKMNFEVASKGNPSLVGYAFDFRNDQGDITHILSGSINSDTNNVVELWDLINSLQKST